MLKVKTIAIPIACLAALVAGPVMSATAWHTAQVKTIYPQAAGGFVIVLATDAPSCPSAGPNKYLFVTVGENGMTADGAKALLATALSAFALDKPLSVAFDDATTYCYVNRLYMSRD